QAEDGIRDKLVTGVQTCALPISGPINATAPHPVRNGEFARVFGRVLHRPAVVPVPPLLLRLLFGRAAANEAMLGSSRVLPTRLRSEERRVGKECRARVSADN